MKVDMNPLRKSLENSFSKVFEYFVIKFIFTVFKTWLTAACVVATGIASLLSASRSATRCSKSLTYSNHTCFVIQLNVPKGVQVGLVKQLCGMTFLYHMELILKSYLIQKYPFRLMTNEIAPFMSTARYVIWDLWLLNSIINPWVGTGSLMLF